MAKKTKLIRLLEGELERAGLLTSDKSNLVRYIRNLEHAFSIKDPLGVAKAINQIAKNLMN